MWPRCCPSLTQLHDIFNPTFYPQSSQVVCNFLRAYNARPDKTLATGCGRAWNSQTLIEVLLYVSVQAFPP